MPETASDLSLFDTLVAQYGYLIGGDDLRRLLAYPSADSFKKACERNTVPIPTFHVKGRRSRFATTHSVSRWLLDQINRAEEGGKPSPS